MHILCSSCFADQGIRLDAYQLGTESDEVCTNCGAHDGRKLSREGLLHLAHRFFVRGTLHRTEYGGAPIVQFNDRQSTSVIFDRSVTADAKLISEAVRVGFFHYGPRLWMVGEITPLKSLENPTTRQATIDRVLEEYPSRPLVPGSLFYRLRINPARPKVATEYDSPPEHLIGKGRLDSPEAPVLYASQDLEVCIHECRATTDDLLYVATLAPNRDLRILDLTDVLEDDSTEFESLDLAIHMLFLAGSHSYDISRDLARAARTKGFDGIAYPSYFSLVRTGAMPFETVYGISVRKLPPFQERVRAQTIRNLALFGRPIADGVAKVNCINRVVINRAAYGISFGPIEFR